MRFATDLLTLYMLPVYPPQWCKVGVYYIVTFARHFVYCESAIISVATVKVSRSIVQCSTHYIHCNSLSVVTCTLPAFSGQLSNGDKDQLDGLFRKAFKRGLCSDVFHIDDLARDADTKLFRQASDHRHCLHPLLHVPKQRPEKLLSSLRSHGHSYTLPHIQFSLYKNTFVNRCLFAAM